MSDTTTPTGQNIEALRAALFDAMRSVRSGALDLDKARAINELGKTLVDTARVEVDYIKATDGVQSQFMKTDQVEELPAGITGTTVHRLR